MKTRRLAILVVVLFLLILIGAGHGAAPIGLFLVFGWLNWFLPNALTSIGAALLIGAAIAGTPDARRLLSVVGVSMFVIALVVYASMPDALIFWVTAIPSAYFMVRLIGTSQREFKQSLVGDNRQE